VPGKPDRGLPFPRHPTHKYTHRTQDINTLPNTTHNNMQTQKQTQTTTRPIGAKRAHTLHVFRFLPGLRRGEAHLRGVSRAKGAGQAAKDKRELA